MSQVDTDSQHAADDEPAKPEAAASADLADGRQSVLGLRDSDRLIAGVLAAVVLALAAIQWLRLGGWNAKPVAIDRPPEMVYEYKVDVNTATWVEWMQLPGVGETLARRIVAHREANGPFTSIEELDRINGIGPKTLEDLRPWLVISEDRGGD